MPSKVPKIIRYEAIQINRIIAPNAIAIKEVSPTDPGMPPKKD